MGLSYKSGMSCAVPSGPFLCPLYNADNAVTSVSRQQLTILSAESQCMIDLDSFAARGNSATSRKDTLHIGLDLGRILRSVQIIIVSKWTQNVIIY